MLQNIPKDKILEVVKQGPTVPSKVVKVVGGDTMLIGAILSTMISTGEVKYSILKVGGSPLYYIPDQEPRLEEFISLLNDKDQKTARHLKEEKILEDSSQDALTRVSLKTIKDFAKPFEYDFEGKKILFYRYFLTSKDEAQELAKNMLLQKKKQLEESEAKKIAESKEAEEQLKKESQQKESSLKEEIIASSESLPKISLNETAASTKVTAPKESSSHEKEKKHFDSRKKLHIQSEKEEDFLKKDFLKSLNEHIHAKNLDIISKEKIKKTEYVLVLKNHDSNEYIYCVAKDKKTINEGDLSTAFVFAHQKKMPCIFLTTGHLSKKAEAMTQKEFKDMTIEKI